MKILNLIQGTAEWHQHRATHFNASDAPAMLGVSPYKTREQLVREVATGVQPEVDSATQRRFDDGHRYEALSRPLAEQIVGEDLFPCVGEDGKFSASFDGLTMLGDTAFEHKSLNESLRYEPWDENSGLHLPGHYQVQMEHQCMVSGAERVLFMASRRDGDQLIEERHCWYAPNPELRAHLVAGWEQFEADVAAYALPAAAAPAPAGRAPDQLPSLRVEVSGMVTASNLDEFRLHAMTVLGSINRDLCTDEDFADAEQTVKWCKGVEDRIAAAKTSVLAQMADVDAVCRTLDGVSEETRRIRLELDRLVKVEKEHRRAEVVAAGAEDVRAHYRAINATLGEHALLVPSALNAQIGESIKGKKTLASIRDAVSGAAAAAKIEASRQAERVRTNMAILAEYPDHASLFSDRVQLCACKAPEDLRNLVVARVSEHRKLEADRLEQERERIRQEEVARLEHERQQHGIVEAAEAATKEVAPAAVPSSAPQAQQAPVAAARPGARIKLGDINARIAPLSISAEGLAALGFRPVGTERAAKLYAAAVLPMIFQAMTQVIESAAEPLRKAG